MRIIEDRHWCKEILCVLNVKLIGTKKNKEIVAKYLQMVQTRYTEPSSDEDFIMGSFLPMYVNEDVNTVKCPNKGKQQIIQECNNA